VQNNDIVTSVRAMGTVETDFDRARFTISLEAKGKTKKEAVRALKAKVAEIDKYIDGMCSDVIAADSNLSAYGDQQIWGEAPRGKKPVAEGHLAWYRRTFATDEMDKVDEIQDALAAHPDGNVAPVSFELKDERPLHKAAVKDAYQNAMRQFQDECEILGKDPKNYEVRSWNVNYQQSHGSQRAMFGVASASAAPEAPAIENDAGKASVTININLNFTEKSGIPIR
jgi:uncharacterized protein YggE